MCSKDMPYRPGTMKRGPNDARHVVWALDKFFFRILVCILDYLLNIYIFLFFCQRARVDPGPTRLAKLRVARPGGPG